MKDAKKYREANRFAVRVRTCPPVDVLMSKEHSELVRRHIAVCPDCRRRDDEDWAALVESLRAFHGVRPEAVEPEVGGIFVLRRELGGWLCDFYLNPPAVLLVSVIDEGLFRAAQVHFDPTPAALGDLVLEHDRTGTMPLIVESWNTYPITRGMLRARIGRVDEEVLAAVRGLMQDPSAYPAWAEAPEDIAGEDDPRRWFRDLEVEVGFIMANHALHKVL